MCDIVFQSSRHANSKHVLPCLVTLWHTHNWAHAHWTDEQSLHHRTYRSPICLGGYYYYYITPPISIYTFTTTTQNIFQETPHCAIAHFCTRKKRCRIHSRPPAGNSSLFGRKFPKILRNKLLRGGVWPSYNNAFLYMNTGLFTLHTHVDTILLFYVIFEKRQIYMQNHY